MFPKFHYNYESHSLPNLIWSTIEINENYSSSYTKLLDTTHTNYIIIEPSLMLI